MELTLNILFIIVCGTLLSIVNGLTLNILQQSSYRFCGVFKWLKLTSFGLLVRHIAFGLVTGGLMLLLIFAFQYDNVHYYSMIIFAVFAIIYLYLIFKHKAKAPLKFTPRMIRLTIVATVLSFGVAVSASFLAETIILESAYALAIMFSLPVVYIAHYIVLPFEKLNQNRYVCKTRKLIAGRKADGLKVIGITGSYGKTMTKNILTTILSSKYNVCGGIASFNTPMGLSRICKDILKENDEILIVEMGARQIGDIAEMCSLALPDMGIITAVGNQHLEFFGSAENIKKTKYELAEHIATDIIIFNGDNDVAAELYDSCELGRKKICGAGSKDVSYDNVSLGEFGCKFNLCNNGTCVEVRTELLGDYVPSLICSATAIALEIGMTIEECAAACGWLKPIAHRLEMTNNGDTIIIDDSYNSNPVGALSALKVLGAFAQTKVIVTPGMVELGNDEKLANGNFGSQIAEYADIAILVGRNAEIIKQGAVDGGLAENKIHCVANLNDAKDVLTNLSVGEKVVLFENDLTDNCG